MKVLIIDDDINKIRQLKTFVVERFPCLEIEERRSYQSGARAAVLDTPEIILLDMTMPTFNVGGKETGGRERRYAGIQILRNVRRKEIRTKVIVVTQFERFGEGDEQITIHELREKLSQEFSGMYAGTIYYEAADSKWTEQLHKLMATLIGEMGRESDDD